MLNFVFSCQRDSREPPEIGRCETHQRYRLPRPCVGGAQDWPAKLRCIKPDRLPRPCVGGAKDWPAKVPCSIALRAVPPCLGMHERQFGSFQKAVARSVEQALLLARNRGLSGNCGTKPAQVTRLPAGDCCGRAGTGACRVAGNRPSPHVSSRTRLVPRLSRLRIPDARPAYRACSGPGGVESN